MLREAVTAVAVAVPFGLGVAAAPASERPEPLFRFVDPEIVESSGLAVVGDLVATVNDSGDEARVFAVDPATGETVGTTRWSGEATDVEALAPAGDREVWVGDIGDNTASRDSITVTRVPVGRGERVVTGTSRTLRYPDGPADAEALLAHPVDGRLVVVTKSVFGGRVYVAPRRPAADGPERLRPRGRVMPLVTDGAFLPDGRHLVLRDYARAVVLTWPGLAEVGSFMLPEQQQGEGLAATADGTLLVSTEGSRAPVHEVSLPPSVVAAVVEPPSPSPEPSVGESSSGTVSREGEELPAEEPGPRDPTQWLIGTGLLVVAVLVLLRALRPRTPSTFG